MSREEDNYNCKIGLVDHRDDIDFINCSKSIFIDNDMLPSEPISFVGIEKNFRIEGFLKRLKSEFKNKKKIIKVGNVKMIFHIWEGISEDIIDILIERWLDRKILSDHDYYGKYYPNFYRKQYIPLVNDLISFRNKNTKCLQPEFWYWYLIHYIKAKSYP